MKPWQYLFLALVFMPLSVLAMRA